VVELGQIVESRQHFVKILTSFQGPQIPGEACNVSPRASCKVREQHEHRMPRDARISCAGSQEEIVTEHRSQIPQCLFSLAFFQRVKAVHPFEAFDVVFPLKEFHSTVPL